MSVPRRVVFDTSSLVGAALQVGSVPHRALGLALSLGDVCASEATLAELQAVLMRPKFDRYQARDVRQGFVDFLRRHAHFFPVSESAAARVQPACRDPEDDKFLALARACEAQVLVSSDADLLVLHPWNGIDVVSPARFLALVDEAAPR